MGDILLKKFDLLWEAFLDLRGARPDLFKNLLTLPADNIECLCNMAWLSTKKNTEDEAEYRLTKITPEEVICRVRKEIEEIYFSWAPNERPIPVSVWPADAFAVLMRAGWKEIAVEEEFPANDPFDSGD